MMIQAWMETPEGEVNGLILVSDLQWTLYEKAFSVPIPGEGRKLT